ncbi:MULTISPECIES: response regulator [unclassified Arcicella]|uniref:LytR/AlgR family response regulator transcription factor n=1 Tax=unclassified Arcicella TaxID=2644986 RepID=UPI002862E50C|nr:MULTISPECIES: response regulator [unclassified Arcicella]MDR6560917.1 two-component system LytT family response regulator [Arcicella sp. BE51]MDR6810801.1 two-component system LytT family response regulator [Arcicella sp. BE140]MDR6822151.1 two-component system LytT family response regulator [Arcicella sp. BE139]
MSKKIKTILVDDERLARQELKYLLQDYQDIQIIDEAENVDDAIEKIHRLQPDLIFLDIEMPEKNGFDLLDELEFIPKIVFVTAYNQYAIQAFESEAMDYLLKPMKAERLARTIEKIRAEIQQTRISEAVSEGRLPPDKRIFLKDGDKCYFVRLTEIYMIESVGNYCRFHFGNNRPMIHRSLNKIQERLDPNTFFRANRQQIINTEYIAEIDSYYKGGMKVVLNNGIELEISTRNSVAFKDMMGI